MKRRDFLRGSAAAGLIGISPRILRGADALSNRVRLCFADQALRQAGLARPQHGKETEMRRREFNRPGDDEGIAL